MKMQFFVHKYGQYANIILFFYLLHDAGFSPKTPVFWAFSINNFCLLYFIFVHGISFGIRNTIQQINTTNNDENSNKK